MIEAYKSCSDAEEAKKTAISDAAEREAYVNVYRLAQSRQALNSLNLTLSAPESTEEIKSWDDVAGALPLVVERNLHDAPATIKTVVEKSLGKVIDVARANHPVYVSPPEFQ